MAEGQSPDEDLLVKAAGIRQDLQGDDGGDAVVPAPCAAHHGERNPPHPRVRGSGGHHAHFTQKAVLDDPLVQQLPKGPSQAESGPEAKPLLGHGHVHGHAIQEKLQIFERECFELPSKLREGEARHVEVTSGVSTLSLLRREDGFTVQEDPHNLVKIGRAHV